MKIVNRRTFLSLPANTLYHKYEPMIFGELEIKANDPGTWLPDFVVDSPFGFIEGKNWDEIQEIDFDFKFDIDRTCRDGLYNEEQLFAVYGNEDIERLINKLKGCIK